MSLSVGGKISANLELKGFEKLRDALGPKYLYRLRKEVGVKNLFLARFTESILRRQINSSRNLSNHPVTAIIKGSNKPLIHAGKLFQSVESTQRNPFTFSVGVNRLSRSGRNIAAILEKGAVIPVTPAIRGWFIGQSLETHGKVKPLKDSTTQIVIPARPFLKAALVDNKDVHKVIFMEWMDAIMLAFVVPGAIKK